MRECPPDHGTDVDYNCNPSLQFISPLYFVSFVLTAQFVLINVVVAVLMKHLDDSNKEAQEEAEMDAEIELELAQGTLCCMGAPGCGGARMDKGLVTAGPRAAGGQERGSSRRGTGEGTRKMQHTTAHPGVYSPAQVSVCETECLCLVSVKGLFVSVYFCPFRTEHIKASFFIMDPFSCTKICPSLINLLFYFLYILSWM